MSVFFQLFLLDTGFSDLCCHEVIFHSRKQHFFLTNVTLDSARQKDPKETMAKVGTLRKSWG